MDIEFVAKNVQTCIRTFPECLKDNWLIRISGYHLGRMQAADMSLLASLTA